MVLAAFPVSCWCATARTRDMKGLTPLGGVTFTGPTWRMTRARIRSTFERCFDAAGFMADQYTQSVADMRFTILLEDDVLVDPRKYGDVVAPALGLTKVEARMAVRKGRGIFLENLDQSEANRIADELDKDGIKAHVRAAEDLPALPAVRKVMQLEHGEELLTYVLPGTNE